MEKSDNLDFVILFKKLKSSPCDEIVALILLKLGDKGRQITCERSTNTRFDLSLSFEKSTTGNLQICIFLSLGHLIYKYIDN